MNDLVSIIIPTYNLEKYISQTIESVMAQTYSNWEIEFTDDCSKDGTIDIIESYAAKDSRIRLHRLEENSGATIARNNSIREARGRYIAFLDGDDWWYPEKLEKQIAFMQDHGYEFSFTAFEYADAELNVRGVSHKPKRISYVRMLIESNVGTPGVIYDASRIGKHYMPQLKTAEDWALWLKLVKLTGGAYSINEPLWKYRILPNSLSKNKITQVQSVMKVYNEVLRINKLVSILMFTLGFVPMYSYKVLYNKLDSLLYMRRYLTKNK